MKIDDIEVDIHPGDLYKDIPYVEGEPRNEVAKKRAEKRAETIAKYREVAKQATMSQINQAATAAIGLCFQLKALGGSFREHPHGARLARELREIADFMEDP